MTSEQQADEALATLKAQLEGLPADLPGKAWLDECGDVTLLRFLKGHKYKVAKVLKLLKNCAAWRQEFRTEAILETWPKTMTKGAVLMRENWCMGLTGTDYDGRPVHYFHLAKVDFPALIKHAKMENMVRHNVFLLETAMRDNPRGEAIMIVDLGTSGDAPFQLKNVTKWLQSVVSFIKAMSKIADPYYPESYFRIYFVRVPAALERLFRGVSGTLNEATLAKVVVLKKADVLQTLADDIPKASIPTELGGESKVDLAPGGKITPEILTEVEARAKAAGEEGSDGDEDDAEQEGEEAEEDKPKRTSIRKSLSNRLSLQK